MLRSRYAHDPSLSSLQHAHRSCQTGSGQCLFVDELSGDFRENLTPVQAAACDGSAGQTWDVLTTGKHNDKPGNALIVSGKTNACLNFDPRRAAGDQVILFSCGGRADGGTWTTFFFTPKLHVTVKGATKVLEGPYLIHADIDYQMAKSLTRNSSRFQPTAPQLAARKQ